MLMKVLSDIIIDGEDDLFLSAVLFIYSNTIKLWSFKNIVLPGKQKFG